MKYIFLLLILTVSFAAFGQTKSAETGTAEQEVRKLEREWLDAYEKFDVEAMNRIVADDFLITFPEGGMQAKAQIIENLKRARSANSPANKFHTEDVQAKVYGDTVILIGRVITEGQREGKAMREENRYTDTYVKRQGRWQVVASHLSNVAQPKK